MFLTLKLISMISNVSYLDEGQADGHNFDKGQSNNKKIFGIL